MRRTQGSGRAGRTNYSRKVADMRERLAPFLVLLEARYAPLLFAVSPQSYAVYLWLFPAPYSITGEVFAVLGAIGFEFIYVGAIAWAEDGKASGWTWVTAAVALLFSVAVAYYVYRSQGAWAWLHAGFPLVAFSYTMQLHKMSASTAPRARSGGAQTVLEVLPSWLSGARAAPAPAAAPLAQQAQGQADVLTSTNGHVPVLAVAAYACPHCSAPLATKYELGAATKHGYCPSCKAERKSA